MYRRLGLQTRGMLRLQPVKASHSSQQNPYDWQDPQQGVARATTAHGRVLGFSSFAAPCSLTDGRVVDADSIIGRGSRVKTATRALRFCVLRVPQQDREHQSQNGEPAASAVPNERTSHSSSTAALRLLVPLPACQRLSDRLFEASCHCTCLTAGYRTNHLCLMTRVRGLTSPPFRLWAGGARGVIPPPAPGQ